MFMESERLVKNDIKTVSDRGTLDHAILMCEILDRVLLLCYIDECREE